MTFTRTVALRMAHNLAVVIALATVVLFGLVSQDKESYSRPAVTNSSGALVEAHGCSTSVADPTHVVVTVDGVARYAGQRMTDRAIEQTMFGVDHGLVVHGFCP